MKEMIKKPTKINAEKAIFNPDKNHIILEKNIEIKQKNVKLTGDSLIYNINKEQIIPKIILLFKFTLGLINSDKQKGQTRTIHNPA